MGMLVEGRWQDEDAAGFVRDGKNVRFDSGFHERVTADGSSGFPAESNRYALYYNRTCPWSHRAAATLALKGLGGAVDEVLLDPVRGDESWWFGTSGEYADPALGATHLHQLYCAADPGFTGRVSVPVLWDKKTGTIVSNDSGMIARMFNDEFNAFAERPGIDLYPAARRPEIDELNDYVADRTTDGVYRCLLAQTQEDYERGFDRLFEALDVLDRKLTDRRYLIGGQPSEPDWRLFGCLVRFDAVYYPLYKCNLKRIIDFTNLWDYTRDLYQLPGIAATVDLSRIKRGYYGTVPWGGFVPKGPALDFEAPHDRAKLG